MTGSGLLMSGCIDIETRRLVSDVYVTEVTVRRLGKINCGLSIHVVLILGILGDVT